MGETHLGKKENQKALSKTESKVNKTTQKLLKNMLTEFQQNES